MKIARERFWKVSSPKGSCYVRARGILAALTQALDDHGLRHPLVAVEIDESEYRHHTKERKGLDCSSTESGGST